jgi:hypothetical protein
MTPLTLLLFHGWLAKEMRSEKDVSEIENRDGKIPEVEEDKGP